MKRTYMTKKAKFSLILVSLALIIISSVFIYAIIHKDAGSIIAWVGKYPITLEEFDTVVADSKASVKKYFEDTYKADIDEPDFWTNSFDGVNPGNYLKEKVLKELQRTKAGQILARKNGIIKNVKYREFVTEYLEAHMDQKTQELRSANPLGDARAMYKMAVKDMVAKTLEKLSNKEFAVSDAEVLEEYDRNKDTLYSNYKKEVQIVSISIIDDNFIINDRAQKKAYEVLNNVKKHFEENKSFDEIKKEYTGVTEPKIMFNQKEYNSFVVMRFKREFPQFIKAVEQLKQGETSRIIDDSDGNLSLIRCAGYKPEGYLPMEQVRKNIAADLANRKYERLIDGMLAEVGFRVNKEVFRDYIVK